MTWILWRALQCASHPSPLFRRMKALPLNFLPIDTSRSPAQAAYVLLFATLWLSKHEAVLFALVLTLPCLVFNGSLYGALAAVSASSTIARERELGNYDLLCTLPDGALSVTWALATASLLRTRMTKILFFFGDEPTLAFGGALLAAFVLGTLAVTTSFVTVLPYLTYGMALMLALYFDYAQSVVIGLLVGMIAPLNFRTRSEARLVALGGFVVIKVACYLIVWSIGFVFVTALYNHVHIGGTLADLTVPALRLMTLCGVQEAVIRWLWHALALQTSGQARDVREIIT
jgi:hypothetical protein